MKEIGGYLELDKYRMKMLHDEAIRLNTGRNCLAYLIIKKNIKLIHIPKFLCSAIKDTCDKYNVRVDYYSITNNFIPLIEDTSDWVYVVNYYGQLDNDIIIKLKNHYPNMIIDNVQAYFQSPIKGIDTIYTCRKYFGVSDGAFLYSDINIDDMEIDESFERMTHILGRFENDATKFYHSYTDLESKISQLKIRKMSKLTTNLLHAIDYDFVKNRREKNFKYLSENLKKINRININVPVGPYMYPLYVEDGYLLRKYLQDKKVYIPILWPDAFDVCVEKELEYDFALNILPLPVDQRYDIGDMKHIVDMIMSFYSN